MKITKQQAIIIAVLVIAIAVVLYFLLRKKKNTKKVNKKSTYSGYNDTITLPSEHTTVEVYIVQEGDTLSEIAEEYGTTVEDLARRNNISNPDLIVVGQKLYI